MRRAGPDPFDDTFIAMTAARAVITAARLNLIGALAEEPLSASELAGRQELDPVGIEALLTALEALEYVAKGADGAYAPTAAGLRVVAGGSDSVAHFVGAYSAHAWDMLGSLEEVLRGGRTAASHRRAPQDPFWEPYIRGLFELSRDDQDEAAGLTEVAEPRCLLDVAGGHGGFAMAMCRRHPRLQATILDLPASVAVGRRIVEEEGFQDRISFREGDALKDDLGEDLDVISIFNLLHHLPPPAVQALLSRAQRSLRTGGSLVIGETERAEQDEPASLNGAMSGLIYFASSGTRNYTRRELCGWLTQAGFQSTEVHRSEDSPWRLLYIARA